MNIDNAIYRLPILGNTWRRMHTYFKTQVAVTDIIHVLIGLGIGMVIDNGKFLVTGALVLVFGAIYHLYAFIKGRHL